MTCLAVSSYELLCRIPLDARVILDVGCGDGTLGAEYQRRNPRAKVFGIETGAAIAEEARRWLHRVYVSDLDTDPAPFVDDVAIKSIDCVVYGSLLAQARDPWQVLRRHMEFLADDGTVLVHLPNLEHWSLAERLLRGTWSSEDQGLFDRTRLRCFTSAGIREMLHGVGLASFDTGPHISDQAACECFVESMAPGLQQLGIDPAAYRQRAAPSQHIWRAQRRTAAQQLTVVSTMLNPIGGVSDVRVVEPMHALKADPSLATMIIANTDAPPIDVDGPRIMILHRPLLAGDPGLERVRGLLAGGWVVVCEFDDHPDYIPVLQRSDIQNFRAVHAIQTTTEPLATVMRQHNREVVVFENATAKLPDITNFSSDDHITVLFAGLNREAEWPPYVDTLNSVAERFSSRVHFEIINDRALFDVLQTKYKRFTPLCGYDIYHDLLSRSEVSFMPLSDTPFNRCKSDLKYLEAAAHRVVGLASNIVYQTCIEDGRTGVLFGTPEQLGQRLSRLAANFEIARSIGDAGRQYIRSERMLAYQLSRRATWYHSLWERREALTRSLLARVPELAH